MGHNKKLLGDLYEEEYYKERAYISAGKEEEYQILKRELYDSRFSFGHRKKLSSPKVKMANFVRTKNGIHATERNRNRDYRKVERRRPHTNSPLDIRAGKGRESTRIAGSKQTSKETHDRR